MSSAIYDLEDPEERVRLAVDQPSKYRRRIVVHIIRRRYGNAAAEALIDELKKIAAARGLGPGRTEQTIEPA